MSLPLLALLLVVLVSPSLAGPSFISIGDWGGNLLGSYDKASTNVPRVAAALDKAASQLDAEFIINTGDSFYFCGIQNTTDMQVEGDWLKPFMSKPNVGKLEWMSVLGNHEYGYNPQAVVELASVQDKWVMDDRYYSRIVTFEGTSVAATIIFLDTSPCVSDYRATDNSYWDPCGATYPTCAGGPVEGDCMFHQNIIATSCTAQQTWLNKTLAAVPEEDWLIVVGHHPAYQVTEFDLVGTLQASPMALYLNGHTHDLAHYTMDYKGAYITTGAGSLTSLPTAGEEETPASVQTSSGHRYTYEWMQRVAGFTAHTFSDDMKTLDTTFYDANLKSVHTISVTKP